MIGFVTTICVQTLYNILQHVSALLWSSSDKLFKISPNFAAVFHYIDQSLQLGTNGYKLRS
jgi:hypothetical protein